jgi:hypothetical protein
MSNKATRSEAAGLGWANETQRKPSTKEYFIRLDQIELTFAGRGVGPDDSVHVTAINMGALFDEDPDRPDPKMAAPTCDCRAATAADLLAKRTHRLATDDEIDAFHQGQRDRDSKCRAITAANQNRGELVLTQASIDASKAVGPTKK